MRRDIKAGYVDWMAKEIEGKKVIAFTLKFRQWLGEEHLTRQTAVATVRRFYNHLCREAYGPLAMRRKNPAKLQFMVAYEGEVSREDHTKSRFHAHGVIEVPKGLTRSAYEDICEAAWTSLKWADPKAHDFKQYRDEGWLEYMLKNRTKADVEASIDLDLFNPYSYRHEVDTVHAA
ncbi:hypothetical protein [Pulveribacter sp.]|uniref:hypothetical protein n=1 Tax=Pulveribacter sp. TaxID=2678893 RepID=UPI0028AF1676|nr:hypothetical protein [Pulveribacter sp.]